MLVFLQAITVDLDENSLIKGASEAVRLSSAGSLV